MMKRHIAAGEIAGGVTLVARHGKDRAPRGARRDGHRVEEADAKDAVFRIASMTKPVTGVAIMMMMEEGQAPHHRSGVEVHSGVQGYQGRR